MAQKNSTCTCRGRSEALQLYVVVSAFRANGKGRIIERGSRLSAGSEGEASGWRRRGGDMTWTTATLLVGFRWDLIAEKEVFEGWSLRHW